MINPKIVLIVAALAASTSAPLRAADLTDPAESILFEESYVDGDVGTWQTKSLGASVERVDDALILSYKQSSKAGSATRFSFGSLRAFAPNDLDGNLIARFEIRGESGASAIIFVKDFRNERFQTANFKISPEWSTVDVSLSEKLNAIKPLDDAEPTIEWPLSLSQIMIEPGKDVEAKGGNNKIQLRSFQLIERSK